MLAATKFAEWAPDDFNITVLVDFENDSVRTALEVARALGPRLWGVRLDTSGQLVDRSLWEEMGDFDPRGVNEKLVRNVRDALDADGFERVKIVASGGFTVEKITEFERNGVPVDAYGVGSSLIRGENDFTADIVMTDGRDTAKVGRHFSRTRASNASRDPLGRRHPGRLHAPGREAATCPVRRRPSLRWRDSSRRRARPASSHVASADDHELDRPGDLGDAGLRDDLSAALPARHPRRARRSRRPSSSTRSRSRSRRCPRHWLEGREFLLLKKHFDVFTNPNAEPLLDALAPDEVVVFGVATDVCDDAAIRGLRARGYDGELRRGCGARARCRAHRRRASPTGASPGVRFTDVAEVLARLVEAGRALSTRFATRAPSSSGRRTRPA